MDDPEPATDSALSELRQRKRAPESQAQSSFVANVESSTSSSDDGNAQEQVDDGLPKKTYGRTPDGRVFTVPTTYDMVSQLLDPRQPKNLSDAVVLVILAQLVLVAYTLPHSLKRAVLAAIFVFWRASYNLGIGWLLSAQSNHRSLIVWARRVKLFEKPETGKNPRPWLYRFLERELKAKIPDADYDFETAPIEYNTWLVFRRLVDLILMCDFASYCLFAVACAETPQDETLAWGIVRWGLGIALVGFNLWVKLDAHRVVKDYAWYWGDFFYLVDQELTFDGVFEMAPHPMYSIGYAGYYGMSLMAASYELLFISILAHLAQFAFLVVIENPHIEKTYNPPPPRQRAISGSLGDGAMLLDETNTAAPRPRTPPTESQRPRPPTVHNLVGLGNVDLFRVTNVATILLVLQFGVWTATTPSTPLWQGIFLTMAVGWRLWTFVGLGVILTQQSRHKMWTRHFVKVGESTNEGWREWKGIYHLSTVMCHVSCVAAAYKVYAVPEDWTSGWALLKHVGGVGLVALQVWTAASIYESLGEFGFFFGDFFFEHEAKLTYTSIYRFLNNPERLFGAASVWGAALITWGRPIFALALLAHGLQLGFLDWVEKPHMQRLFGRKLRREAGLTKFIKRSLPPPVKGWQESVDRVFDDTTRIVHEFVESARPRLAVGVMTVVKDTSTLFNMAPARLTITRLPGLSSAAGVVAEHGPQHYRLDVEGSVSSPVAVVHERVTGKEGDTARLLSYSQPHLLSSAPSSPTADQSPVVLRYGSPLQVRWTAPADHDKADWIGLYMVTDNRSRDVTEVPSVGRWAPTTAGTYDSVTADSSISVAEHAVAKAEASDPDLVGGEVVFAGDKLWWTQGVYELRYHHGGSHTVMAISRPFEVRISRFDGEEAEDLDPGAEDGPGGKAYQQAVEAALLPLVQNCLDRDPDIAPATAEETFGSHVERDGKYAKRVVYVVHHMFGIDFAPAVVQADGNVRKLAWRICNAKRVLAPYSMSRSRGTTTPAEREWDSGTPITTTTKK